MTYEQFVLIHVKFLKEHPELANMQVVYASDDEGNSFHRVHSGPVAGEWDGDVDFSDDSESPNAVCIN